MKKGVSAAVGFALANTLFCSGDDNKSFAITVDEDIFNDTVRDALAADTVISKKPGIGTPKPNIIVILTDDMGYGDPGCYGNEAIQTPHIDTMAREGVRFTDFYCSSPLCSPSRAGLLTGRYPLRSGITFPLQPGKDTLMRKVTRQMGYMFGSLGIFDMRNAENVVSGLPASEITIAEALKVAGYTSGAIGKWHLGDFVNNPQYHPHNYGFDFFTGFNASNDDWPAAFWRDKTEIVKDIGLDQGKYTGLFTREAVSFIERSKDRPFFLYLAHKDPHQPCIPSKDFEGKSEGGPHGDTVTEVDWSVGEIMKALKKNGLDKNTLVIFTSDNGPWFDGSPGGLRGRKGMSFEGGFRVPMIARWPRHIPPGSVCREPAMNIDFFPTMLDLAGLTLPSDRVIDGKNIMGLFDSTEKKSPHDALFYFHYNEIEGVRSGKWKYFRYVNNLAWPIPLDKPVTFFGKAAGGHDYRPEGSDKSVPTMASWPILYNMERDCGESYNVMKKYPREGDTLLQKIRDFEKKFRENPRGWL
ncbi:MAG: arylsulfatase [Spirochaetae bacterium HGW-Spirochaetae-1]|jgi:arylsulfatase A-like enzyme|nr:MAG: arylsulfatase [Spirochaetae bacterium HGW-Spirochaetae-1]